MPKIFDLRPYLNITQQSQTTIKKTHHNAQKRNIDKNILISIDKTHQEGTNHPKMVKNKNRSKINL